MARGTCTFRQRDVTAAIKAAKAAGVDVARIEVDRDGKVVILAGKPPTAAPSPNDETDMGL